MSHTSLMEVFAALPDPRKARGRVHPLPAILGLAVVAMLAGHTTYQAIAQFGRDHGKALAFALGFRRGKTPAKSTFSEIFRAVDIDRFEAALHQWLRGRLDAGWRHVAIDGKTLRGSGDGEVPAVHLLAAYVPAAAAVIGQLRVDATTNEHKAALKLLAVLPLTGAVVSGDAMFTHRDTAQTVLDGGGDYLLVVKDNQSELKAQIDAALNDDAAFSPYQRQQKAAAEQTAQSTDKGHGRREQRRLTSTTALNGYVDWPAVGQVFEVERVRTAAGETTVEVAYGITSLTRAQAAAADLLGLVRQHWGIENGLHYVRDETLREDRCRVRKGHGAQLLAALRNVTVHLLHRVAPHNKAAATRRLAIHPKEAVLLIQS